MDRPEQAPRSPQSRRGVEVRARTRARAVRGHPRAPRPARGKAPMFRSARRWHRIPETQRARIRPPRVQRERAVEWRPGSESESRQSVRRSPRARRPVAARPLAGPPHPTCFPGWPEAGAIAARSRRTKGHSPALPPHRSGRRSPVPDGCAPSPGSDTLPVSGHPAGPAPLWLPHEPGRSPARAESEPRPRANRSRAGFVPVRTACPRGSGEPARCVGPTGGPSTTVPSPSSNDACAKSCSPRAWSRWASSQCSAPCRASSSSACNSPSPGDSSSARRHASRARRYSPASMHASISRAQRPFDSIRVCCSRRLITRSISSCSPGYRLCMVRRISHCPSASLNCPFSS